MKAKYEPCKYKSWKRAELKLLDSPDADLACFMPEQPDCFRISISATIGFEGEDGADIFDLTICTPRWLLENCREPMWGRHMLIVPQYDFSKIKAMISDFCRSCEGENWTNVSEKLSRIGHWEYEDYHP